MSDSVVSIFDKFTLIRGGEKSESSDTVLETYQAAIIERSGKRAWSIRICYSDGSVEQISYSHRKYELSITPDQLAISFTSGIALIKGKNLRLLLDDLQDERIRCIQPFDPAKHKTPKETEVVISSIEWKASTDFRKPNNSPTN